MALNPLEIAGTAQQGFNSATQKFMGVLQLGLAMIEARKNKKPIYQIDPAFQYNIDILKNTMGLPQSALNLYYNSIGKSTNQGINAILGAGGNANQISSLVGNQNQQFQQIAVQDALQKKQDIGGILAAQLALAGEKDKQWQINEYSTWADKAQAIAAQKAAGWRNIGGSANASSGALANTATMKLADDLSGQGTQQPITTPNSGVNTNWLNSWLQQNSPQLNFGQPNNQFNFQPPQGLPFQQGNNFQQYPNFYNPYIPYNPNFIPNQQLYFGQ